MNRTILVTGGAGYIGSQTCKALAGAGYKPVTYDNLSRGFAELVKWGPLAEGDILDTARLSAVIGLHRPAAVVHFAALIEAGESVGDPARFYSANLVGTFSLLQAMREQKVEKLVFSSTAAVYGEPVRVPMAEGHRTAPINPYGQSKLMAERVIADFAAAYRLSAVTLRYFNAAGADPGGEIGRLGIHPTHLIPNVLAVAAGEAPALRVFGSDYPTPDGTCVRDYVHVADLASAHVAALQWLKTRHGGDAGRGGRAGRSPSAGAELMAGRTYNLGTGRGWSVMEVVRAAEKVTGRKIPLAKASRRPGDPGAVVADATRARKELGWEPIHSDIETILRTAWEWKQAR
jgi:UDP-arabinose 4-epimerase